MVRKNSISNAIKFSQKQLAQALCGKSKKARAAAQIFLERYPRGYFLTYGVEDGRALIWGFIVPLGDARKARHNDINEYLIPVA